MISGIFHQGSGLGNQLARYVMTRVLAVDRECDFGMINPGLFKGYSFMNLDFGEPVTQEDVDKMDLYIEKRTNNEKGVDIRGYDWEGIKTIQDNTVIDGEFQGEEYYEHHKGLIDRWLEVEPLDLSENLCVIGFRGGEYTIFPDLFLTKTYWDRAIAKMLEINPEMTFKIVTDDPQTAQVFFPDCEITHEIGRDWRHVRYAKYLILANSSFYILPAWLNDKAYVIAPWGWGRHNLGFWATGQNIYKGWNYLKLDGTYEKFL